MRKGKPATRFYCLHKEMTATIYHFLLSRSPRPTPTGPASPAAILPLFSNNFPSCWLVPGIRCRCVEKWCKENERGKEKRGNVIRRRTGEWERLRGMERMVAPGSGVCLFKCSPAALSELSYELLIRQLIGYGQGYNPIEKAFASKQVHAIACPWETAPPLTSPFVWMHVSLCMCVSVCMCVCSFPHTCTYTHTFPFSKKKSLSHHLRMINTC